MNTNLLKLTLLIASLASMSIVAETDPGLVPLLETSDLVGAMPITAPGPGPLSGGEYKPTAHAPVEPLDMTSPLFKASDIWQVSSLVNLMILTEYNQVPQAGNKYGIYRFNITTGDDDVEYKTCYFTDIAGPRLFVAADGEDGDIDSIGIGNFMYAPPYTSVYWDYIYDGEDKDLDNRSHRVMISPIYQYPLGTTYQLHVKARHNISLTFGEPFPLYIWSLISNKDDLKNDISNTVKWADALNVIIQGASLKDEFLKDGGVPSAETQKLIDRNPQGNDLILLNRMLLQDYFGSALANTLTGPSIAEQSTPEIQSLARNLENDPVRIYDYVHNYVKYEHYFGSKKGPMLTLLEMGGNDFDQCALLVSLLRAAGLNAGKSYVANYQFGLMRFPYYADHHPGRSDLKSWLGLSCPFSHVNYNNYAGILLDLNKARGFPKEGDFYNRTTSSDKMDSYCYIFPDCTSGEEYYHNTDISSPTLDFCQRYAFHRVWVQFSDENKTYLLDPSYKIIKKTEGISLPALDSVAGISLTELQKLTATTATTAGANYIKDLDWAGLEAKLKTYSQNLVTDFTKAPDKNLTVDQVTGAYVIQETTTTSLDDVKLPGEVLLSFDYQGIYVKAPVQTWSSIPELYMSKIEFQVDGVTRAYNTAELAGRKISLRFDSVSHLAQLYFDDILQFTGTQLICGDANNAVYTQMKTSIQHPYGSWDPLQDKLNVDPNRYYASQSKTKDYLRSTQTAKNLYVITYSFGDPSNWISERQKKLGELMRKGLAYDNDEVVTESLHLLGLNYCNQTYQVSKIVGDFADVGFVNHHMVGCMAQESSYYIDFGMCCQSYIWRKNRAGAVNAARDVWNFTAWLFSALEHGAIEQNRRMIGVSTVKAIYEANKSHIPIWLLNNNSIGLFTQNNNTTHNYTQTEMALINNEINANINNATVLIPESKPTIGSWHGLAYAAYGDKHFGLMVDYLHGGVSTIQQQLNRAALEEWRQYVESESMAISRWMASMYIQSMLAQGENRLAKRHAGMVDRTAFAFNTVDLALAGSEPRGLSFVRKYDSGCRFKDASEMGYGWSHNYNGSVMEMANPFAGLGNRRPVDMAAFIAGARAGYVLNSSSAFFTENDIASVQDLNAIAAIIGNNITDPIPKSIMELILGCNASDHQTDEKNYLTTPSLRPPLCGDSLVLSMVVQAMNKALVLCTYNVANSSYSIAPSVAVAAFNEDQIRANRKLIQDYFNAHNAHISESIYYNTPSADFPTVRRWTTTALIAEWTIDQLTNNMVMVNVGATDIVFTRQPDGTLTPPTGAAQTLSKVNDNYILQQRHGNTYQFNAARQLYQVIDPYGKTLTYNYNPVNKLLYDVTDCYARKLTFTYYDAAAIPARLKSIKDEAGNRTVSFEYSTQYSTQGDLVSFTDAEGKKWSYQYDGDNKMTANLDPSSRIMVANTYDADAKLIEQLSQGDDTKLIQIITSDRGIVHIDAKGGRTTDYLDKNGYKIKSVDADGHISHFSYDISGNLISNISPKNEETKYEYNDDNNVTKITDPLGYTTIYDYYVAADGAILDKHVKSVTDKRQHKTSYTYNNYHQIKTITTPDCNVSGDPAKTRNVINDYDTDGNLKTVTDADSFVTTYGYDTYGLVNKCTYPNTDYVEYKNKPTGDVEYQIDANAKAKTTYEYNGRRQVTKVTVTKIATSEVIRQTQTIYDDAGNVWKTLDAKNNTSESSYNALGQVAWTKMPALSIGTPQVSYNYDERDSLSYATSPLSKVTRYTYNLVGQNETSTDPLSKTTTYGYDADHHLTSIKSPLVSDDQTTISEYNARGELTATYINNKADTTKVQYTYDENGAKKTIVNRNGKTFGYNYYDDGTLHQSWTPLGKTKTFEYNKRGLLQKTTDPKNNTETLGYDNRGRLTSREDGVAPGAAKSIYGYDKNNNLLTHTENSKLISRVYDEVNRLSSYTTENNETIGYQYDANNNLTWLTYPGGKQVHYEYDSNNHLIRVTDWANRVTTINYDLAGRMASIVRPNLTVRIIVRDDAGQVTQIKEMGPDGMPLALVRRQYDEAGRPLNEFIAPVPQAYSEDTHSITYDSDNRINTFSVGGQTVNVGHDNNGNMITGPLTTNKALSVSYTYDARNRLTAVAAGDTLPALSYTYDSEGNRTAITQGTQATRFIVNPASALSQVLVRVKPDQSLTYYVYGIGLLYQVDSAENMITYHYDSRGSTMALTDRMGQVTGRVEYSIYGRVTRRVGVIDTPFLYNGRFGVMTDTNGLYYMRARYYNPYIRRFVNADPSGMDGGLNWFAFANGDPICMIDPFGLDAFGYSYCELYEIAQAAVWGVEAGADAELNLALGILFNPGGQRSVRFDPIQNITGYITGHPAYETSDYDERLMQTTDSLVQPGQDLLFSFGGYGTRNGLQGEVVHVQTRYFPNDPLPQQRVNDVDIPLPDPMATGPHTTLGTRTGNDGVDYLQSATFPEGTWPQANGMDVPWSRVDWYDHGRPWDHPDPHQHIFIFNGRSWQSGPQVPFYP